MITDVTTIAMCDAKNAAAYLTWILILLPVWKNASKIITALPLQVMISFSAGSVRIVRNHLNNHPDGTFILCAYGRIYNP